MPYVSIPNLPMAVALDGTEQLEVVQAGVSRRSTTGAIGILAGVAALTARVAALEAAVFGSGGSTQSFDFFMISALAV